MNIQEAIKTIEKMGEYERFVDEPISKKSVLNIINQIDEPQKPKVPQVAIEFYERYKDDGLDLGEWFSDFYSNEAIEEFSRMDELTKWLHDNDNETNRQREFALATLVTLGIDAVEVEQEKLYTVEIPNPNFDEYRNRFVLGRMDGKVCIKQVSSTTWEMNCSNQLTESEIKKDFAWALEWAKPVEEE